MVGKDAGYRGSTRQPDGLTGFVQPTAGASNINLKDWKVYGPALTTGPTGVPNGGGLQTYPHPLASALAAPSFTTDKELTIVAGVASTPSTEFRVAATGNPLPTVTRDSGSATGVTFTPGPNLDGFGMLTWTTGTVVGNTNWVFRAANGIGTEATQNFTLKVVASLPTPPTISTADNTSFTVGTLGTFTVTATGDSPITLSIPTNSLPQGVSFTDNGGGSGTLTGTPVSTTLSPWHFDITASNGISPNYVQHFTLTILPSGGPQAPHITSSNNTTFTAGTAGSFNVTASGTTPITFSISSGTLPSGVTLTANGSAAATLASTTATVAGSYSFTIRASNGTTPNDDQPFSLTVKPPVVVGPTPPSIIQIAP
jgi:hypothetical protein